LPGSFRQPARHRRPEGPRVKRVQLEEDAEVLVAQHVGVEHDRAPRDLPRAPHLTQRVLATTREEVVVALEMRAVHDKRGLGLYLAVLQRRRRLEIADQVTGARRGILGSGDPGVEPGHPHLDIAPVLSSHSACGAVSTIRGPTGVRRRT
jgi:hypothetical protein